MLDAFIGPGHGIGLPFVRRRFADARPRPYLERVHGARLCVSALPAQFRYVSQAPAFSQIRFHSQTVFHSTAKDCGRRQTLRQKRGPTKAGANKRAPHEMS
jgi:hypothetical protein